VKNLTRLKRKEGDAKRGNYFEITVSFIGFFLELLTLMERRVFQ